MTTMTTAPATPPGRTQQGAPLWFAPAASAAITEAFYPRERRRLILFGGLFFWLLVFVFAYLKFCAFVFAVAAVWIMQIAGFALVALIVLAGRLICRSRWVADRREHPRLVNGKTGAERRAARIVAARDAGLAQQAQDAERKAQRAAARGPRREARVHARVQRREARVQRWEARRRAS